MFQARDAILQAVRGGFSGRRVLVAGDLMLDRYLRGPVQRISPEAPVPVVQLKQRQDSAGGAANVARNLAKLGLSISLFGVTGQDAHREALVEALRSEGISTEGLIASPYRTTTCKTRVLGDHQQMLRIDEEVIAPLMPEEETQLFHLVSAALDGAEALILSDYGKGVFSPNLTQRLIQAGKARNIPVLVDPKGQDFSKYQGATLITPNQKELGQALGLSLAEDSIPRAQAEALRTQLDLEYLLVTLGEQGCLLLEADGSHHIPAVAREVFDVSGAGDTVIATLAAGLISGLSPMDAAQLANLAAGVVVGKLGTVPITQEDLWEALTGEAAIEQAHKILSLPQAQSKVAAWRSAGARIVFTNGCFDLLHVGHVSYLEQARQQGDRLIVGLNTDRSVRAIKGAGRPVIGQEDRARILAALAAVDLVVLFDEETPLSLILALRPQVLVKGADYREEAIVGAREVRAWGGEVVRIPLVEDRSTTRTLQRLECILCKPDPARSPGR